MANRIRGVLPQSVSLYLTLLCPCPVLLCPSWPPGRLTKNIARHLHDFHKPTGTATGLGAVDELTVSS